MGVIARVLATCGLAIFGGCTMVSPRLALETPASFRGVARCDGCEGIETTLTLRDDALYFLRQRAAQAATRSTAIELGRWRLVDRERRLVLEGGTPRTFRVVSASRLEETDAAGSTLSGIALERLAEVDEIGGPFRVRGNYAYLADAARIVECVTGRSFRVAMAGESADLERAYLDARVVSGVPMLVTFEGRLARVTRMDDADDEDAFVVDRFERVWPSASCTSALSLPLVGTRWRLEAIDGFDTETQDGAPELLFAENGRITGSNGCNQINGAYTYHDDALTFGPIASTRRACVEPTKRELEKRFGSMLGGVNGVRLEHTDLVLLRGSDELARFNAAE
jgi:copper homeostasis protein (lipoprotein)